MSARDDAGAARVLVLGKLPEILETVVGELVDLGLDARGSTDGERASGRFDARDFDLITFGGGLRGPVEEQLKQDFARQNPRVRFLDVHAPLAAHQIASAVKGGSAETSVDLDAYCARIGYSGPLTPTLKTLRALTALHPAAIPFEAIDVLLDRGIDLAPAAVDAKLIAAKRGGYCYEQNDLFRRVLSAMGFEVEPLLGRVRWMLPPGSPPTPRSHMVLRVTIDGEPWLADVGFGVSVPTAPLQIDTIEPQPTTHDTYRVIPFGGPLLVQARIEGKWMPLYQIEPERQLEIDFAVANWYTSTHPASHFRHRLIAARSTPEARYALLENRLTIRPAGGETERRRLSADELERALAETFCLPVEPDWGPVIERAAEAEL